MGKKYTSDDVTVIIPTYNESKTIGEVLQRTKTLYKNVLIVDSIKSRDNIGRIAKRYGVKILKDEGIGKGNALRCGINASDSRIIVFMDGDGSHVPEDIPKMIEQMNNNKADLVIASRFTGGSFELFDGTFDSLFRTFFTMVIAVIINWRFHTKLVDPENGFRAIKTDVAKKLKLKSNKFDIETEILMKCLKNKYIVAEIPSREYARKHGVGKLSIFGSGKSIIWRMIVNFF